MRTFRFALLLAVAALCSSCLTSIITTAMTPTTSTTTVVQKTSAKPVTTVQTVTPLTNDICFYLDLQAVAAAFGEARNVQEFERMLNSSKYMLTNLDLNRDGFIDYLRVMEARQGYTHVFVIQAVLAQNYYQDVATLVVDCPSSATTYVQVIGEPFIYGSKYIMEPVYMRTPPMYSHLRTQNYSPWSSPYSWDRFPDYYAHQKPLYLSHYQAYVRTYMDNHHYCRQVNYVTEYRTVNYTNITVNINRSDYSREHPSESFSRRNADVRMEQPAASSSAVSATSSATTVTTSTPREPIPVRNARDLTTLTSSTRQAPATTATSTAKTTSQPTVHTSTSSVTTSRTTTTTATQQQPAAPQQPAAKSATTTATSTRTSASQAGTTTQSTAKPATTSTRTSASQAAATAGASTRVTSRVQSNGVVRSTRTRTAPAATTKAPATTTKTTTSTTNTSSATTTHTSSATTRRTSGTTRR